METGSLNCAQKIKMKKKMNKIKAKLELSVTFTEKGGSFVNKEDALFEARKRLQLLAESIGDKNPDNELSVIDFSASISIKEEDN